MRAISKIAVFVVVALVGISRATGAQKPVVAADAQEEQLTTDNTLEVPSGADNAHEERPEATGVDKPKQPSNNPNATREIKSIILACSVDVFLKDLNADAARFPHRLDVSGCHGIQDEKLVKEVLSFLRRKPRPAGAATLIRLIQESYSKVTNKARFTGVANSLRKGLESTDLAFSPVGTGDQNLLDPLIEKLRTTAPPITTNRNERENLTWRLSPVAESRFSAVQKLILEKEQEIQKLQGEYKKLDSVSKKTAARVSSIKSVLLPISAVTLLSLGLLVYLIMKRFQDSKQAIVSIKVKDDLVHNVGKIETRLTQQESTTRATQLGIEELTKWRATLSQELMILDTRLQQLESPATPQSPDIAPTDLDQLTTAVKEIKGNINGLFEIIAPLLPLKDLKDPLRTALSVELGILREAWNKFLDNKERVNALEKIKTMRWEEVQEPLLSQLPPVVPEELRPTFDTVVAPARDFHNLVTKIGLIQRLLNNELPPLPNEHQALMRVREFINLLTMIQNSNLVADRLNFRLERWVEDQFLGFADLYLQKYQKSQLENDGARLEPGLQIVRRVLKVADLEPVDLTLGVTAFDSTRQVGRSTTCDPSFANGLILGVVRNGFVRGGQVLRQPEVIVNRVD